MSGPQLNLVCAVSWDQQLNCNVTRTNDIRASSHHVSPWIDSTRFVLTGCNNLCTTKMLTYTWVHVRINSHLVIDHVRLSDWNWNWYIGRTHPSLYLRTHPCWLNESNQVWMTPTDNTLSLSLCHSQSCLSGRARMIDTLIHWEQDSKSMIGGVAERNVFFYATRKI